MKKISVTIQNVAPISVTIDRSGRGGGNPITFAGTNQIGMGVSTPDASAKLQVDSTTQGFLPPRMSTTEKNDIATPAAGLMVYDTDQNQMNYYNGTGWIAI